MQSLRGLAKADQEQLCFFPVKSLVGHYKHPYWEIIPRLLDKDPEEARVILRHYFLTDLFFMVYFGLKRVDVNRFAKPFLVKRCKEIDDGPVTDTLDLWARGHYKTTFISQGRALQDALGDTTHTIGFFSHTRPSAKAILRPIKHVLETNALLRFAFNKEIWANPFREAPVWSLDDGLTLRRPSESNTQTFEAWGLVDGMPIGKHFSIRDYDDVITEHSVTSPEQVVKAEDAFALSDNLGDGVRHWQRLVGTIYASGDFYCKCIKQFERGVYPWHIRKHPWYDQEVLKSEGRKVPVLLTMEAINERLVKQGQRIFAAQMELNPFVKGQAEFNVSKVQYYSHPPQFTRLLIIVDPANEKKKDSDLTALAVMGFDEFGNRYFVDGALAKMDLGERWNSLVLFKRRYRAASVWYEKYGKDADDFYFKSQMQGTGIHFKINTFGGAVGKKDRIRRLVPVVENGQFFVPSRPIIWQDLDLVDYLLKYQIAPFPFLSKFDLIDAISRVEDPELGAFVAAEEKMGHNRQNIEALREQIIKQRTVAGV